jgi:phosphoglycolate phosphatase-like HAD superfamily hydrolase
VQVPAELVAALEQLHARGACLRILSDANSFFIEEILEANGLAHLFDAVVTNPASFDSHGARVSPGC